LIIGVALFLAGATGLMSLYSPPMSMAGMMGGGMMMGRDGMKGMMKEMMGAQLPPGIEPRDLPEATSNGARLLGQYCTQCHEMPGPGMHTAEEWPRVVDRMNQRMQMMSGRNMMRMMHDIKAPSDNELQILAAYLQKHAQQAIDKTQYTDLNSPAGKTFMATCSQCHALPDPKQHTAAEWPTIVERMTRNMDAMGKAVPDQETLEVIVAYLQKHAK
jgi:cytochrome c5